MQNVDSDLGFRQLIEQDATTASFLRHFDSFNEPTYDNQNNNYIQHEEVLHSDYPCDSIFH